MNPNRVDSPAYRADYRRGWTTGRRGAESALERADDRNEPDAWMDGYLDYAAGRERFHLLHCTDHSSC